MKGEIKYDIITLAVGQDITTDRKTETSIMTETENIYNAGLVMKKPLCYNSQNAHNLEIIPHEI